MVIGRFTYLDWSVVAAFLLLMIGIGWRFSARNKTQDDYALGGRSMNSSMVGLSLFATLMSTLSYLSYPGEMIKYGPVMFAGCIAYPFAYVVVKRFLIPRFMKINVTSAYEILELTLGKGTRTLATIFFLTLRFLWMSTIIYATVATALVPIFGVSQSLVPIISVILVIITVVYTTMGGIKAVVFTDVLQTAVMFLGVFLALFIIAWKVGDFGLFFESSLTSHWEPIKIGIDATKRMTICNIIIMRFVWQICTAGSDQMAIQRYFSTKDANSAAHSYKISLISSAAIEILLAIVGFMVLAYFTFNPEMMAAGTTIYDDADTLFPRFILIGMPQGITGLIAAAIMAAAMSSLSSGLNSSATVIQEDIIKRLSKRKEKDSANDLKTIKLISVLLGISVTLSCYLVSYVSGNLFDVVVKVVNLVVAPLFVLFFMALFVRKATNTGTIAGGLFSFATAVAIAFFEIFGLKPLWIMPIALITGIIVGISASRIEKLFTKI